MQDELKFSLVFIGFILTFFFFFLRNSPNKWVLDGDNWRVSVIKLKKTLIIIKVVNMKLVFIEVFLNV